MKPFGLCVMSISSEKLVFKTFDLTHKTERDSNLIIVKREKDSKNLR